MYLEIDEKLCQPSDCVLKIEKDKIPPSNVSEPWYGVSTQDWILSRPDYLIRAAIISFCSSVDSRISTESDRTKNRALNKLQCFEHYGVELAVQVPGLRRFAIKCDDADARQAKGR